MMQLASEVTVEMVNLSARYFNLSTDILVGRVGQVDAFLIQNFFFLSYSWQVGSHICDCLCTGEHCWAKEGGRTEYWKDKYLKIISPVWYAIWFWILCRNSLEAILWVEVFIIHLSVCTDIQRNMQIFSRFPTLQCYSKTFA